MLSFRGRGPHNANRKKRKSSVPSVNAPNGVVLVVSFFFSLDEILVERFFLFSFDTRPGRKQKEIFAPLTGSGDTSTISYPAGTTVMQLLTTAGAPSSPPPPAFALRRKVSSQTPQLPLKQPACGGSSPHASAALVAAARRSSPASASISARR